MYNHHNKYGGPGPRPSNREQQKFVATGSNSIAVNSDGRPKLNLRLGGQGQANRGRGGGGRGGGRGGFKPQPYQAPPPFVPVVLEKPEQYKLCSESTVDKPATQFRLKEDALCSMFLIRVEQDKKAYRYDVDIVAKDGNKIKPLSKGSDDGQKALNRNLCYELLTVAYVKTEGFEMDEGGEVIYDCKSILYTSQKINLRQPSIEINGAEVNDYIKTYCGGNALYTVSITQNQAVPTLDIGDLSQYEKTTDFNENRAVRTFLEMAITQFSINNNIYSPVGAGKLFETSPDHEEYMDNGIVLRAGVAKGVRVVENYGNPAPALVLDMKISPFYQPQELLKTILDLTGGKMPQDQDWYRIGKFIINLRVEVAYSRNRSFAIGKFTDKPFSHLRAMHDGRKVSMVEFFQLRHGLALKYPDFPGVIPNTVLPKGRNPEVFPIEQLIIMEDQRVPLEKMHKKLSEHLLKVNTLPPRERFQKIMGHAEQMAIFNDSNAVLNAFGITIQKKTNQVVVGVRSCPRIYYGDEQIIKVDSDKAKWTSQSYDAKFVETAEIGNWIIFCEPADYEIVGRFIELFRFEAEKAGITFLKDPVMIKYDRNNHWTTKFPHCVTSNINFILLIASKRDRDDFHSHDVLKYYESLYKIITQHVSIEIVHDVVEKHKKETLKNIIQKTNCKNFGLNYIPLFEKAASRFILDANQTLVIAYDVAHPPPVTSQERRMLRAKGLNVDSMDPSIVGICSNMASNPNAFVGDYFYQESRKEQVSSSELLDRIPWIMELLAKNRGRENARPPIVFILRDGLSEGQALMAYDEELCAIRQGFKDLDPNYTPKVAFIIGTKRHYKKFFALREGEIQNLAPGSVVAEKFVRGDLPEFFLQSHYPIKGVGKPVEYTVICDEIGVSQDALQGFLNGLCYSHQIVTSAISLPEPVYQADELAKRGLNNYLTMKKLDPQSIPRMQDGLVNMRELTRMLSYRYDTKNLVSTRFTA